MRGTIVPTTSLIFLRLHRPHNNSNNSRASRDWHRRHHPRRRHSRTTRRPASTRHCRPSTRLCATNRILIRRHPVFHRPISDTRPRPSTTRLPIIPLAGQGPGQGRPRVEVLALHERQGHGGTIV
jgi:hypothetical protein